MSWWHLPIREAKWSVISEQDAMFETLCFTAVKCMFGENVIVLLKMLSEDVINDFWIFLRLF